MLFCSFWYSLVPCFCLGASPKFPPSANICAPQVHSLALCPCLLILFLSVIVYRPFCQYLCPLGAIYGLFNRFSLLQIHWDEDLCTSCAACENACPLSLTVQEISRSPECIRCGKCVKACPVSCLHFTAKSNGYSTKHQTCVPPGTNTV